MFSPGQSHIYYCSVDGCTKNLFDNTSFYRVPKDPIRCDQWKQSLGFVGQHKYANLTPDEAYKRIKICRAHFPESAFTTSGKRLLGNAVPMKMPVISRQPVIKEETMDLDEHFEIVEHPSAKVDKCDATTQSLMHFELTEHKSIQTPARFAQNTPQERALKYDINKLKEEIKIHKRPKETQLSDVFQFLDENYPVDAITFIKNQLLLLDKKSKGARYTQSFKQFAVVVYSLGPTAYEKLSRVIRLPSWGTLKRTTRTWPLYTGFNDFIFRLLALRVSMMPEIAKDCILCFDEMPIKPCLFYNISRDTIMGFEEFNGRKSNNISKSALVVMARGISHKWTHPISHFYTKNSATVDELKEVIFESIRILRQIGLNVLAITSDQGLNFYKLAKNHLQLTYEKPYFYVDEVRVFYIFDVPHLLRATRNSFFNYKFCLDHGITNKTYLETAFKLDKKRKYRLAPKLTEEHVNPNPSKKNNVTLAAQVLSQSVAVAIYTFMDFKMIPTEAKATVQFIEDMNSLFDMLNSSDSENSEGFSGTRKQVALLNKMFTLFTNLKVVDESGKNVTNTLRFPYSWRITISSTLMLWEVLKGKKYKRLLTRNLNEDCLQHYFLEIRRSCSTAHPKAYFFSRGFKKLFMSYFDEKGGNNCAADVSDILLAINSDLIKRCADLQAPTKRNPNLNINACDYTNILDEEGNLFNCVRRYLATKCLAKHSCDICLELFNADEPENKFSSYLRKLDAVFVSSFIQLCMQDGLGFKIKQEVWKINFVHPCVDFPYDFMLCLFTRVRLYYTLKFANHEIKSCAAKNPFLMVLDRL